MNYLVRLVTMILVFLIGAAAFTTSYCQAPLFYSNQNQYFVHGMARAGLGTLEEDWLANTADPTPGFSWLVERTEKHLPEWMFYVYHAALLGLYSATMFGLFWHLAGPEMAARRWPVFLFLFVTLHSAALRWLSYRYCQFDYVWFFQSGVAGQYVLGGMLQPSMFGVLLVVAVWQFARGRPHLAAVSVATAALAHSTYLLPGALLMLGFLKSMIAQKRVRPALVTGSIALLMVTPGIVYVLQHFGPTSPEAFAEAQDIIVNFRIPHHSRVDLWLDWVAGLQIGWAGLAILCVRRTPLFLALGVPFAISAALTALQAGTDNNALAVLFPWRVSAVLVPIATTLILTRCSAARWVTFFDTRTAWAVSLVTVAGCISGGVVISTNHLGYHMDPDDVEVMRFVRETVSPGDVYLLPLRVPDLKATTRGSLSSDFKPVAAKKRDGRVIPVDLQRFRLHAGAPIFIDFKAIPYKDVEVIEWRDRVLKAKALNDDIAGNRVPLAELRRLGITHVVVPAAVKMTAAGLERIHEDPAYQVFRVTESPLP